MPALEALVAPETAGDPMSAQTWVRSSLRTLSRRLAEAGHAASPPTVGRLLGGLEYALHANRKRVEPRAGHADRDVQFGYIADQRAAFAAAGRPILSVDTKKKELVGNFKQAGRAWSTAAEPVNTHDFPSDGHGRAVPYGLYDVARHRGHVAVGQSGDTPAFAVDALAGWWRTEGRAAYPDAEHLLLLADGGGSNGHRPRAWKARLQAEVCDRLGLAVTVCHYPTGCSKWNPIEHRLFGPISTNWAGTPLRTWETLLAGIRGTTSRTGLTVSAALLPGVYPKGQAVSEAEMDALHLERHAVCPNWNYTLRPRTAAPPPPSGGEVIV